MSDVSGKADRLAYCRQKPLLAPRLTREGGTTLFYTDAGGRPVALTLTPLTLAELELSIASVKLDLARIQLSAAREGGNNRA